MLSCRVAPWQNGGPKTAIRTSSFIEPPQLSGSAFHGISEPLYFFVFTLFRTENRCARYL
jgi:hypothetical protein